jgi:hypothetical protein
VECRPQFRFHWDGGGADMFLHATDLKAVGIDPDSLKIGDRLIFETGSTRDGKPKANKGIRSAAWSSWG